VAVLALGGYGRRHLCLHSDIDLLILFGGAIGAPEEAFLRAFLHPLWDVGVVVGHQVRELREFDSSNRQSRVPAGAHRRAADRRRAQLFDRFSRLPHRSTHAFILRSLLELIESRHARSTTRSTSSSRT
jgi:UTP:GlnB (protein PII) uridylyltransferase